MIKIQLSEAVNSVKNLKESIGSSPERFGKKLDEAATKLVNILKQRTPRKTGKTRDSIRFTRKGDIREISAGGAMEFLHFGTKRHWIEPVNASVLRWVENGHEFFSKGHFVSGIKALKIMKLTKSDKDEVKKILQTVKIFKK